MAYPGGWMLPAQVNINLGKVKLSKLNLEGDKTGLVAYPGGWMLSAQVRLNKV